MQSFKLELMVQPQTMLHKNQSILQCQLWQRPDYSKNAKKKKKKKKKCKISNKQSTSVLKT